MRRVEAGLLELPRVVVDRDAAARLRRGQSILLRGPDAPSTAPPMPPAAASSLPLARSRRANSCPAACSTCRFRRLRLLQASSQSAPYASGKPAALGLALASYGAGMGDGGDCKATANRRGRARRRYGQSLRSTTPWCWRSNVSGRDAIARRKRFYARFSPPSRTISSACIILD